MIRIVFCITELDPGGAERALLEIVSRLDRTEFDPHVICLAEPGELVARFEDLHIPVTCLHSRGVKNLLVIRNLTKLLRDLQPDILQTFLFQANFIGRLAGHRAKVPIICSGVRVAERRGRWRGWLLRMTNRKVTHHICVSQAVAEFVKQRQKLSDGVVTVIPNGVHAERFAKASPYTMLELNLPEDARLILFVGRLDFQKAPEILLAAFARSAEEDLLAHLLLVGDGPMRSELERETARLQLSDRVHLLGPRDDVPRLLKSAHVFVLPSRWEGMPNAVLEAMAAGVPVIATPVEGTTELITDGVTGRLVTVDLVEELQQAIQKALTFPEDSLRMAKRAQDLVVESFTWETVSKMYAILYKRILSNV